MVVGVGVGVGENVGGAPTHAVDPGPEVVWEEGQGEQTDDPGDADIVFVGQTKEPLEPTVFE